MLSDSEDTPATCGPVVMEVSAGAMADPAAIQDWLGLFVYLPLIEESDFVTAGELYRRCRSKGVIIRSQVDCLIAAVAIRNEAVLLHCDRDFDHLAKVSPLRILDPKSLK